MLTQLFQRAHELDQQEQNTIFLPSDTGSLMENYLCTLPLITIDAPTTHAGILRARLSTLDLTRAYGTSFLLNLHAKHFTTITMVQEGSNISEQFHVAVVDPPQWTQQIGSLPDGEFERRTANSVLSSDISLTNLAYSMLIQWKLVKEMGLQPGISEEHVPITDMLTPLIVGLSPNFTTTTPTQFFDVFTHLEKNF